MRVKGRFVIVSWDGGGNVPPALAIGRRLGLAGHQVRILGSPSLQDRFESGGLDFRGFRHAPDWGSHLGRTFDVAYLLELLCGPGVGQDLESELAREPADAAVVDFMLWGALAKAEQTRIATAAFVHTLYQMNREGSPGAVWNEQDLATTNQTRRALGLAPIVRGGELWDAVELMLVLVPKAFDRPAANLPHNVRYVGPVLGQVENRKVWDLPWAPDHPDPLVLVSFSTTHMAQEVLLQRTLDALTGLRIRGLVTAGPSVDTTLLNPTSNTVVRSHIDHQTVLPHTAAVITHAGLSTVMAALTHGVPLLCVPMGRDQGPNSERVEACGAGRTISPDCTAEEIRAALKDVLGSPRYKQGAQRMARIIKREANGSMVVPLLESLLPKEVV
jgi:MGT family glycosyltransferase